MDYSGVYDERGIEEVENKGGEKGVGIRGKVKGERWIRVDEKMLEGDDGTGRKREMGNRMEKGEKEVFGKCGTGDNRGGEEGGGEVGIRGHRSEMERGAEEGRWRSQDIISGMGR